MALRPKKSSAGWASHISVLGVCATSYGNLWLLPTIRVGGPGKHVEVDETLISGKSQYRGFGSRLYKKTMVMGMVERGGKLRAGPVPDDRIDTLEPLVVAHVRPGTKVSTDGLPSYNALGETFDHGVVRHAQGEWRRGEHHTNSIEGHWPLFKRAVRGTHVHISSKHAWKYISEFSYRHNMRHSHSAMFNLLVHAFSLPRFLDA
jgi:transposase